MGTREDDGYLFNSIVPVKFTENSKIVQRSEEYGYNQPIP